MGISRNRCVDGSPLVLPIYCIVSPHMLKEIAKRGSAGAKSKRGEFCSALPIGGDDGLAGETRVAACRHM
jgi:hypothetical protein